VSCCATLAAPGIALGSETPETRKQPAFVVIGGTVFREPGFALPGAEVVISPAPAPSALKPIKARTDSRGEFAVRVPSERQRYKVEATARGYERQEKTIQVTGDVRTEVTFTLAASSK